MVNMIDNKSLNDVIDIYINNKYNYPNDFTEETIKEKNEELKEITEEKYYSTIIQARPYYDVVKFMNIQEVNISIVKETEDIAHATLDIVVVMLVGNNLSYSSIQYITNLTLEKYANNTWLITDESEEGNLLNNPINPNDYLTTRNIAESSIIRYVNELDNHKNIKYMFKGQPQENPFESDKDIYIDTYNLLYWLYLEEGVELQYPINANYFFTEGMFYTVFGKGHKYKVDVDKFEIGDILFFGRSDTNIGIYIDNGDFISMMGKFPKDDTSINIYSFDDYWDEFNGRVMRFDEGGYI